MQWYFKANRTVSALTIKKNNLYHTFDSLKEKLVRKFYMMQNCIPQLMETQLWMIYYIIKQSCHNGKVHNNKLYFLFLKSQNLWKKWSFLNAVFLEDKRKENKFICKKNENRFDSERVKVN